MGVVTLLLVIDVVFVFIYFLFILLKSNAIIIHCAISLNLIDVNFEKNKKNETN